MTEPVAIEAPDVVEASDAVATSPDDERGPGTVGVALLVAGFVLAGLAQYLPWSSVDVRAAAETDNDGDAGSLPSSIDLDLASFNNGHVIAYLGTLALALVCVGVIAVTRGQVRRAAAAAGTGLLAANALVLVGFRRAIEHVGGSALASYRLPEDLVHVGSGYFIAIAATVVLAAGLVLAARLLPGLSRRRPVDDPHDGTEPLELTVSPVR